MDLVSALRIAVLRWKITVLIFMLALIAAAAAFLSAGAVYSAVNYVVVVPNAVTTIPGSQATGDAQSQADSAQRSALVSAGGARLVSNLLVTNMNSAQARAQFGDSSSATYSVSGDTQLPVVTVTATGSDAAAVKTLLSRTIDGADGVLAGLQTQAGIPASSAYRAPRFTPDPIVTVNYPDRTKIVIAILVAGIALAIVVPVALNGPLTRREQSRSTAVGEERASASVSGATAGDVPYSGDPPIQSLSDPRPVGPDVDQPRPQHGMPEAHRSQPADTNDRTERLPSRSRANHPRQ